MTLTEFLLARIAEDEESATVVHRGRWNSRVALLDPDLYAHVVRQHPARVLAECEAKRRILELHRASTDHGVNFDPYCVGCWEECGYDGAPTHPCQTVRILALPYADHPDYDLIWRL